MNDIECLDFYNKNIKGTHYSLKYISKIYPIFGQYIQHRFIDIIEDHKTPKELIYRIEHKIEELPKCPICGKILKFDRVRNIYKSFCSSKCRYSDSGNKLVSQQVFDTKLKRYGTGTYNNIEKQKQTNLEKYGFETSLKNENVKNKIKQTLLDNYGVDNPFKSLEIQNKIKALWLEKYGVDNPFKSTIIYGKSKKTMINRYGVDCIFKSKEFKDKIEQANIQKYGVKCTFLVDEVKEKIKKTNLERYGVDIPLKSSEIQNKIKQTCLERYGMERPLESKNIQEKIKKICLEKYGTEIPTKVESVKNKIKQTCLEKYGVSCSLEFEKIKIKSKETLLNNYGVDNPFKSIEIKNKIKSIFLEHYGVENPMQSDIIKMKFKQTCLEKYGCEYPMQNKEIILKSFKNRYDINKSYKFSKKENEIYNYLIMIDKDTKRQYYSELYPFHCDFYLPKFDVYIEYQGMWTHGKHPFNKDNTDDIEILNNWEIKAQTSKFYKSAIINWTITDPLKRETAKINKLNYLEIFYNESYKEIIDNYLNNLNEN